MSVDDFFFDLDNSIPNSVEVGQGTMLVLSGYCFHLTERVQKIDIHIGKKVHKINHIGEIREDIALKYQRQDDSGNSLSSGFWGMIPVDTELVGRRERVTSTITTHQGSVFQRPIASIEFTELGRKPVDVPTTTDLNAPLVAVCIATFEPNVPAFERQVQSIVEQNYTNWICIVHDDGSDSVRQKEILDVCKRDERIVFRGSEVNRGFYWNFESCLRCVPDGVDYVALADQDDYWYPSKIEALVDSLKGGALLTYSDMRLVDESGKTISETYWENRRNNHTNLDVLLLANTITGAAMMFKTELLQKILPFPEKIGDAFHDHWIASTALYGGTISYVERPLYDYMQHGSSVIGHCDFSRVGPWGKIKDTFSVAREFISTHGMKSSLFRLRNTFIGVYRYECRRIELIVETVRIRSGVGSKDKERTISTYGRGLMSAIRLWWLYFRVWGWRQTTNDAELRLAGGYLAHFLDRVCAALFRYVWRRTNEYSPVEIERR